MYVSSGATKTTPQMGVFQRPVRTAVVGTGHLGRFHAQKYAKLDASELVGVVDMDRERAKQVATEVKTKAFASVKDLYGAIDAVSIVTPTASHFAIGMEMLSRGIGVLMEKPIAMSLHEADALIKEAEKTKAVLQVGHLERFNPAVVAAEGLVKAPRFIECVRESPFPYRSTDIDVILDMMIHDIEVIQHIVDAPVEGVDAAGERLVTGDADVANATLRFKNGCTANLTANRASKERIRRLRVYADEGYVTVDYANQTLIKTTKTHGHGSGFAELVDEDVPIEKKDTLLEEIRSFLNAVGRREAPVVSGIEARDALAVALRIQESLRLSSRPVR